ncbi:MAG: hypothetical protein ACRDP1_13445 [Nocardioidaceae bacterium]
MTHPVFLHIGPPRSGTSYLRNLVWHNKRTLARHGLLYPGFTEHPHDAAVADLLGRAGHVDGTDGADGVDGSGVTARDRAGAWDRIALAVSEWDGGALVAHEGLVLADDSQIREARQSFQGRDVHVVYTARDLSRVIPATWQARLRAGSTQTWASFTDELRDSSGFGTADGTGERTGDVTGDRFWSTQGGAALERWAADLEPDHVHVVTVPRAGTDRGLLWARYAAVLGLDPVDYDTDVPFPIDTLGLVESAYLRHFNATAADRLSPDDHRAGVRQVMRAAALDRPAGRARLQMTPAELEWLRPRCDALVSLIDKGGYDVHGDLADLIPAGTSVPERCEPRSVTSSDLLDLSIRTVVALVESQAQTTRELRALQAAPPPSPVRGTGGSGMRRAFTFLLGHRLRKPVLSLYHRFRRRA